MLVYFFKKFWKPKEKKEIEAIQRFERFVIRYIKPQYYKLLAPILEYILENASPAVREKLIQCCKELLVLYKKFDVPYIDCLFINPCYNNAIILKKSGINAYLNEKSGLFNSEKRLTIKVTKLLIISGWDFWPKFAKLDLSAIVELDIHNCKIDLWDAPKLNSPSIKKLKVSNTRFVMKNELQFVLQDFSNVEHVE
uniref:Uncharacterized protein n=1 Tax=Panagrolaimus davidi TaxID=227884 RepID=A0A914PU00_9BILA